MTAGVTLRATVEELLAGRDLAPDSAEAAFEALIDGAVPEVLKAAFLIALRAKGERPEELAALATAMLRRAAAVPHEESVLVDTCGTGGDGSNSVNLSTAAALLVAAAGVPVAKHGNRSVSSRAGSADLVEALGLPFAETPEDARHALERDRFAFLFAPAFHAATAAIVPVRRALGLRTVFNVLGPLVNPARPTHQLTGTGGVPLAERMARALALLDVRRAFVVSGAGDWDEATPVGPFELFEVSGAEVTRRSVEPADYGIERCSPEDLVGGDAARNAEIVSAVLAGERAGNARHVRDAVVLNAALVFQLLGDELDPRAAAQRAEATIDRGDAARFVDVLGRAAGRTA